MNILLVEDDTVTAMILSERLQGARAAEFHTTTVGSLAGAMASLETGAFNLILLDLILPDSQGLGTLRSILDVAPHIPVVVLTGCDDEELAIGALQEGAQDYLVKGADDGLLIRSVRYAIERSRGEAELKESQEALLNTQMHLLQVEKLDSVGRLAAGIAHEIRNPLAVIQMGVDVMRQTSKSGDKVTREILGDMDEAIGRASSIISGLLDFCMPTTLEWKPTDVNQVLEEALMMAKHEIRAAGVELRLSLQENLPTLNLDHRRIQEVVLVLIINAIDAMRRDGVLTINTSSATLDKFHPMVRAGESMPGATLVLIEVIDTGTGVPADVMPQVFDPFFTTKPVGQGTGLGLSISKNIVELHGGRISLENNREGGTKASIMFVV